MTDNKYYYLAVDIESTGARLRNPINAIGVCFGTSDGDLIDTKAFCMPVPDDEFEPRCREEFWEEEDNKPVLKRIRAEQTDTQVNAWFQFLSYLDNLENDYDGRRIRIVNDNPGFDIARIDYELDKRFDRLPMRYTKKHHLNERTGKTGPVYRWVLDPSERLEQLGLFGKVSTLVNQVAKHDHWPANDAYHIYLQQIVCDKVMAVMTLFNWNMTQIHEHLTTLSQNIISAQEQNVSLTFVELLNDTFKTA